MSEPALEKIPKEAAFTIMFVSIGMSCFIWQAITTLRVFYKSRKPIVGIVCCQATLGVVVTFVTLLASIVNVNCTFLLLFSVAGVNIGDITLQFVLLWKAYLGHNRSRWILVVGFIPILAIAFFILANFTFARSDSSEDIGFCQVKYPTYIVIMKSSIDCVSNTFLSACFISVIYRHYKIFGSSIQKTLIKEGLIYCFGVCISNILTGIFLAKKILGGTTYILYTIDWYLASYLIIKQLGFRHETPETDKDEESICESEVNYDNDITTRQYCNQDTIHSPSSSKFERKIQF